MLTFLCNISYIWHDNAFHPYPDLKDYFLFFLDHLVAEDVNIIIIIIWFTWKLFLMLM